MNRIAGCKATTYCSLDSSVMPGCSNGSAREDLQFGLVLAPFFCFNGVLQGRIGASNEQRMQAKNKISPSSTSKMDKHAITAAL